VAKEITRTPRESSSQHRLVQMCCGQPCGQSREEGRRKAASRNALSFPVAINCGIGCSLKATLNVFGSVNQPQTELLCPAPGTDHGACEFGNHSAFWLSPMRPHRYRFSRCFRSVAVRVLSQALGQEVRSERSRGQKSWRHRLTADEPISSCRR
jgi:hypothetical protein